MSALIQSGHIHSISRALELGLSVLKSFLVRFPNFIGALDMTSAIGFGMSRGIFQQYAGEPDPSKMADKMFSKVDANSDGNITKDEMQTVFDQTSSDRNCQWNFDQRIEH